MSTNKTLRQSIIDEYESEEILRRKLTDGHPEPQLVRFSLNTSLDWILEGESRDEQIRRLQLYGLSSALYGGKVATGKINAQHIEQTLKDAKGRLV